MKQVLIALLALAIVSCGGQTASKSQQSQVAATENATVKASNPDSMGRAETAKVDQNGISQELTIYFPKLTAKAGSTVCVDVQVRGFEKLLSMQYTVAWNKNILKFKELKNFNLPYLDENDFGMNHTQDGLLTHAWLDDSLKSATVPDGASVYQICFDVIGKPGESSFVKITDRPTDIEVANLSEKIIPLKKEVGEVKVE